MRESDLEGKARAHARDLGMLTLKLNVQGQRGWPDHLFVAKGKSFFIEFKRPGEKPTPIQIEVHRRIRAKGVEVFVVDNLYEALTILTERA